MRLSQHIRATAVLGLPLIGSHLAQLALHLVDTMMLGWYDVTALAASTLATTFFFIFFIMGSGFSFAVMGMIAEASGAGDETRIRRVTRMTIWLSVIYAAVIFPVLLFSRPTLIFLGQEPELAELASQYLLIVALGLFPALLVMVIKSYLAALEHTRIVLYATTAAVFVNAFVNWVLIFGNLGAPELGIVGAAYASVASSFATLAVLFVYAARVFPEHALFHRLWRADWPAFGEVFRLGWPVGITNLAEAGMFSVATLLIGLFGEMSLAAHGIALQLASATFMVYLGLSQAATVRSGRALGRRDLTGLWRVGEASMVLTVTCVLLTLILFLGIPEHLLGLFLAPDDPDRGAIIAIGVSLLAVAALFQAMDAGQVLALGMLRGIQDTRVPMVLAGISYWLIGIPTCWVLGHYFGMGAVGVWGGLTIGLLLATVFLWARFVMQYRSLEMKAAESPA